MAQSSWTPHYYMRAPASSSMGSRGGMRPRIWTRVYRRFLKLLGLRGPIKRKRKQYEHRGWGEGREGAHDFYLYSFYNLSLSLSLSFTPIYFAQRPECGFQMKCPGTSRRAPHHFSMEAPEPQAVVSACLGLPPAPTTTLPHHHLPASAQRRRGQVPGAGSHSTQTKRNKASPSQN